MEVSRIVLVAVRSTAMTISRSSVVVVVLFDLAEQSLQSLTRRVGTTGGGFGWGGRTVVVDCCCDTILDGIA